MTNEQLIQNLEEHLAAFEHAAGRAIDQQDMRRWEHYGRRWHETNALLETIRNTN